MCAIVRQVASWISVHREATGTFNLLMTLSRKSCSAPVAIRQRLKPQSHATSGALAKTVSSLPSPSVSAKFCVYRGDEEVIRTVLLGAAELEKSKSEMNSRRFGSMAQAHDNMIPARCRCSLQSPSGGDMRVMPGAWERRGDTSALFRLLRRVSSGEQPERQPFDEARAVVRSLDLKSQEEWVEWWMVSGGERPQDIPLDPDEVYGGEEGPWQGWPDFLGCSSAGGSGPRGSSRWLPFEEARDSVRALGLKSNKEWKKWSKSGERPSNIPASPNKVYKDKGWLSWGDFLGYRPGHDASRNCSTAKKRPFAEALDYARSLGLESHEEWEEWSKSSNERPSDIPFNPNRYYKDEGWKSWGDFLGYKEGYVPGGWLPFGEARDYARTLRLTSQKEWQEWNKSGERPHNLPATPNLVYKDAGWLSWGDFLGHRPGHIAKNRKTIKRRSFTDARIYARSLGLTSTEAWSEWSKSSNERPPDIPSNPHKDYKDKGWKSWADFLGYKEGYVPGGWLPFEEARDYARTLGLISWEEWQEWSKSEKKPHDLPATPDEVYKDAGWLSWGDFLGFRPGYDVMTEWLPFEEAREYVRALGLSSHKKWTEWSKSGARPSDIPSNPNRTYKDEGWVSWPDFLGYRPSGHSIAEDRQTKTKPTFTEAGINNARTLGIRSNKKERNDA